MRQPLLHAVGCEKVRLEQGGVGREGRKVEAVECLREPGVEGGGLFGGSGGGGRGVELLGQQGCEVLVSGTWLAEQGTGVLKRIS